ncbi:hypothetical protein ZOD2009_16291 [Haladaptatus paucihalophilus DX253]|uniref:Uncharacterized protein n=1 Tax=Haladaptatus paucihalophilus DX253 TaxID=797209 RepID=E7QWS0_HALPU|nr:hypothetical protein ZOD2009_16291 [Haladaptatus paucihalophilus DX253]
MIFTVVYILKVNIVPVKAEWRVCCVFDEQVLFTRIWIKKEWNIRVCTKNLRCADSDCCYGSDCAKDASSCLLHSIIELIDEQINLCQTFWKSQNSIE